MIVVPDEQRKLVRDALSEFAPETRENVGDVDIEKWLAERIDLECINDGHLCRQGGDK